MRQNKLYEERAAQDAVRRNAAEELKRVQREIQAHKETLARIAAEEKAA